LLWVSQHFTNLYYSFIFILLSVLHPRHKLEYFKAQKWEHGWIQTARDIVREEFDRSYKDITSEDAMQVDKDATVSEYDTQSFSID